MIKSESSALIVRFRGVRGSVPSPGSETARYGGNTSCLEVRSGDELLIFDAGTGIRKLGEDLMNEFDGRPINANLLISHTHWDHIQGLPFFRPGYSSHNRISIIAPRGRGELLECALTNQMNSMHFPVGLEQMRGLTGVRELASDHTCLGNISISVASLNHPGGCAGFRVEANGATIGYLPDHEPFQNTGEKPDRINQRRNALLEFVRDLDLLILDTQYTEAEYQTRIGWGHGSLPESVALAVDAGVRRLAFFHHDPAHTDDQIDEMVETAQALAGSAPMLLQGASENETITLGGAILSATGAPLRDVIRIGAA